jgi:thiol-disulfide isomerase/thioredoxin
MRALVLCLLAAACSHPAPKPAPVPTTIPEPRPAVKQAPPASPSWIGVRFDHGTTRVIRVVPGGPAEQAGVKIGDQITVVDGHAVFLDLEAVETIRGHAPGKTPFVVKRGGKDVALTIAIAEMPSFDQIAELSLLGKPAPPFAAERIAGTYSPVLKDLAGNVVVVDFWATWCGPCAMTLPFLDQWQTTYGPRGLRIVGLTAEEPDVVKEFLAAHPLSYAIARDVEDQIGQRYLRFAVPMLVVIDKAGVVRHVQVGAENFGAVEAAITKLL